MQDATKKLLKSRYRLLFVQLFAIYCLNVEKTVTSGTILQHLFRQPERFLSCHFVISLPDADFFFR